VKAGYDEAVEQFKKKPPITDHTCDFRKYSQPISDLYKVLVNGTFASTECSHFRASEHKPKVQLVRNDKVQSRNTFVFYDGNDNPRYPSSALVDECLTNSFSSEQDRLANT
jgi:hypothetical protein